MPFCNSEAVDFGTKFSKNIFKIMRIYAMIFDNY